MCGIFAIFGKRETAESIYHAIIQLQHRGQDGAGIFLYDQITGRHHLHKDLGLVSEVMKTDPLILSHATWGLGHVRYPTIGKGQREDTQPFVVSRGGRVIAMAHNGNVVNYVPAREELEKRGEKFVSRCDVEVILRVFANGLDIGNISFKSVKKAARTVFEKIIGAYSVVAIIEGAGLAAFRDPHGIRPLLFYRDSREGSFAFASETNALSVLGYSETFDVKSGEVIFIDKKGRFYAERISSLTEAPCSFEYNYFSKPNTVHGQREVYATRSLLGVFLAEKIASAKIMPDAVVPIPTTARTAAIAIAKKLGISYEEGFVKQENIGRTFIMPTQGIRQKAVCRKLAAVKSVFRDKSVILVDDSIVRGTVSKRVIKLAKEAGAKKVFFASSFPPITHPCLYGIDFPHKEQLIANATSTIDEIAEKIGADAVFYNNIDDLKKAIKKDSICAACVCGRYPTSIDGLEELQELRQKDLKEMEQLCVR